MPPFLPLSSDLLLALILYATVASVTPGPNNVMLLASGVNFGYRRTLPHMLGIGVGFAVMIFLVGLGLTGLFTVLPWLRTVLSVVSVGYLLWLAWKIATAAPPPERTEEAGKPLTFLQAAGFQWVNPKAWSSGLTACTLYAPAADVPSVAMVSLAFLAVNFPCVSLWAGAGTALRGWLRDPVRLRVFNAVMAALLVATLWPVLLG